MNWDSKFETRRKTYASNNRRFSTIRQQWHDQPFHLQRNRNLTPLPPIVSYDKPSQPQSPEVKIVDWNPENAHRGNRWPQEVAHEPDRSFCTQNAPKAEEGRQYHDVPQMQSEKLDAATMTERALPQNSCPRSEQKVTFNPVIFTNIKEQQVNMAEEHSGELSHKRFFTVGSHIKCRYQGGHVEGEVAAFQNSSRLLVIRAAASNGKSSSNDVYVINADCVDKISVDDRSSAEVLRPIDFQKLEKRRLKSTGLKKARIRALSADVAPEGRKLFLAITKTIDEVAWDGDKILVLNEVKISPPYRVEDVQGDKEASVVHVKKIVDKHWKEQGSNAGSI